MIVEMILVVLIVIYKLLSHDPIQIDNIPPPKTIIQEHEPKQRDFGKQE